MVCNVMLFCVVSCYALLSNIFVYKVFYYSKLYESVLEHYIPCYIVLYTACFSTYLILSYLSALSYVSVGYVSYVAL